MGPGEPFPNRERETMVIGGSGGFILLDVKEGNK